MGAQELKTMIGVQEAPTILTGTIKGMQLPLERVLLNVGFLLNDARSFPTHAMERLDIIHQETVKLYETVTELANGSTSRETELR